ncbi:hypothetical protein ACFL1K_05265, partial [Candidatus Omnitrophota bacterium]
MKGEMVKNWHATKGEEIAVEIIRGHLCGLGQSEEQGIGTFWHRVTKRPYWQKVFRTAGRKHLAEKGYRIVLKMLPELIGRYPKVETLANFAQAAERALDAVIGKKRDTSAYLPTVRPQAEVVQIAPERIIGDVPEVGQDYAGTMAAGQESFEQGKWQQAKDLFTAALGIRRNDNCALAWLAYVNLKQGDIKLAEVNACLALGLSEDKNSLASFVLGVIFFEKSDYLNAKRRLRKAAKFGNNSPELYYYWGLARIRFVECGKYTLNGNQVRYRHEQATWALRRAIRLDNKFLKAYIALAGLYILRGMPKKAAKTGLAAVAMPVKPMARKDDFAGVLGNLDAQHQLDCAEWRRNNRYIGLLQLKEEISQYNGVKVIWYVFTQQIPRAPPEGFIWGYFDAQSNTLEIYLSSPALAEILCYDLDPAPFTFGNILEVIVFHEYLEAKDGFTHEEAMTRTRAVASDAFDRLEYIFIRTLFKYHNKFYRQARKSDVLGFDLRRELIASIARRIGEEEASRLYLITERGLAVFLKQNTLTAEEETLLGRVLDEMGRARHLYHENIEVGKEWCALERSFGDSVSLCRTLSLVASDYHFLAYLTEHIPRKNKPVKEYLLSAKQYMTSVRYSLKVFKLVSTLSVWSLRKKFFHQERSLALAGRDCGLAVSNIAKRGMPLSPEDHFLLTQVTAQMAIVAEGLLEIGSSEHLYILSDFSRKLFRLLESVIDHADSSGMTQEWEAVVNLYQRLISLEQQITDCCSLAYYSMNLKHMIASYSNLAYAALRLSKLLKAKGLQQEALNAIAIAEHGYTQKVLTQEELIRQFKKEGDILGALKAQSFLADNYLLLAKCLKMKCALAGETDTSAILVAEGHSLNYRQIFIVDILKALSAAKGGEVLNMVDLGTRWGGFLPEMDALSAQGSICADIRGVENCLVISFIARFFRHRNVDWIEIFSPNFFNFYPQHTFDLVCLNAPAPCDLANLIPVAKKLVANSGLIYLRLTTKDARYIDQAIELLSAEQGNFRYSVVELAKEDVPDLPGAGLTKGNLLLAAPRFITDKVNDNTAQSDVNVSANSSKLKPLLIILGVLGLAGLASASGLQVEASSNIFSEFFAWLARLIHSPTVAQILTYLKSALPYLVFALLLALGMARQNRSATSPAAVLELEDNFSRYIEIDEFVNWCCQESSFYYGREFLRERLRHPYRNLSDMQESFAVQELLLSQPEKLEEISLEICKFYEERNDIIVSFVKFAESMQKMLPVLSCQNKTIADIESATKSLLISIGNPASGPKKDALIRAVNARVEVLVGYCLMAYVAKKLNSIRPRLEDNEFRLVVEGAVNPCYFKTVKDFVPVSLRVRKDNSVVVISGFNRGCKTVTMKTVGLLTVMAQAGMLVPAKNFLLNPQLFNSFCRITIMDQDEYEEEGVGDPSTLPLELRAIEKAVQGVDRDTFVVIDDDILGGSSQTASNASFFIAALQALRKSGALTMAVTQHLHALQVLWERIKCDFAFWCVETRRLGLADISAFRLKEGKISPSTNGMFEALRMRFQAMDEAWIYFQRLTGNKRPFTFTKARQSQHIGARDRGYFYSEREKQILGIDGFAEYLMYGEELRLPYDYYHELRDALKNPLRYNSWAVPWELSVTANNLDEDLLEELDEIEKEMFNAASKFGERLRYIREEEISESVSSFVGVLEGIHEKLLSLYVEHDLLALRGLIEYIETVCRDCRKLETDKRKMYAFARKEYDWVWLGKPNNYRVLGKLFSIFPALKFVFMVKKAASHQAGFSLAELVRERGVIEFGGGWDREVFKRKGSVVKNDFSIMPEGKKGGVAVLTGFHTGGKSVMARLIGQITAFALANVPVPAEFARVGDFRDIQVISTVGEERKKIGRKWWRRREESDKRSGLEQALTRCHQVIKEATPYTLVILDELFGGATEPTVAAALTAATVEALSNKGATVILVTHLLEILPILKERLPYTKFYQVETEEIDGEIKPTFRFKEGIAPSSYGLERARQINWFAYNEAKEYFALLSSDATSANQGNAPESGFALPALLRVLLGAGLLVFGLVLPCLPHLSAIFAWLARLIHSPTFTHILSGLFLVLPLALMREDSSVNEAVPQEMKDRRLQLTRQIYTELENLAEGAEKIGEEIHGLIISFGVGQYRIITLPKELKLIQVQDEFTCSDCNWRMIDPDSLQEADVKRIKYFLQQTTLNLRDEQQLDLARLRILAEFRIRPKQLRLSRPCLTAAEAISQGVQFLEYSGLNKGAAHDLWCMVWDRRYLSLRELFRDVLSETQQNVYWAQSNEIPFICISKPAKQLRMNAWYVNPGTIAFGHRWRTLNLNLDAELNVVADKEKKGIDWDGVHYLTLRFPMQHFIENFVPCNIDIIEAQSARIIRQEISPFLSRFFEFKELTTGAYDVSVKEALEKGRIVIVYGKWWNIEKLYRELCANISDRRFLSNFRVIIRPKMLSNAEELRMQVVGKEYEQGQLLELLPLQDLSSGKALLLTFGEIFMSRMYQVFLQGLINAYRHRAKDSKHQLDNYRLAGLLYSKIVFLQAAKKVSSRDAVLADTAISDLSAEAIIYARKVVEESGNILAIRSQIMVARIYAAQGKYEDALAAYRELVREQTYVRIFGPYTGITTYSDYSACAERQAFETDMQALFNELAELKQRFVSKIARSIGAQETRYRLLAEWLDVLWVQLLMQLVKYERDHEKIAALKSKAGRTIASILKNIEKIIWHGFTLEQLCFLRNILPDMLVVLNEFQPADFLSLSRRVIKLMNWLEQRIVIIAKPSLLENTLSAKARLAKDEIDNEFLRARQVCSGALVGKEPADAPGRIKRWTLAFTKGRINREELSITEGGIILEFSLRLASVEQSGIFLAFNQADYSFLTRVIVLLPQNMLEDELAAQDCLKLVGVAFSNAGWADVPIEAMSAGFKPRENNYYLNAPLPLDFEALGEVLSEAALMTQGARHRLATYRNLFSSISYKKPAKRLSGFQKIVIENLSKIYLSAEDKAIQPAARQGAPKRNSGSTLVELLCVFIVDGLMLTGILVVALHWGQILAWLARLIHSPTVAQILTYLKSALPYLFLTLPIALGMARERNSSPAHGSMQIVPSKLFMNHWGRLNKIEKRLAAAKIWLIYRLWIGANHVRGAGVSLLGGLAGHIRYTQADKIFYVVNPDVSTIFLAFIDSHEDGQIVYTPDGYRKARAIFRRFKEVPVNPDLLRLDGFAIIGATRIKGSTLTLAQALKKKVKPLPEQIEEDGEADELNQGFLKVQLQEARKKAESDCTAFIRNFWDDPEIISGGRLKNMRELVASAVIALLKRQWQEALFLEQVTAEINKVIDEAYNYKSR